MYCGTVLDAAAPAAAEPAGGEPAPEAGEPGSPAAAPALRPPTRRTAPIRSGGGAAKATLGGLLTVGLVCLFIGLKVCRVVDRVAGKTVENQTVTVDADGDYGGILQVTGSHNYTFEVKALDGPCKMGVTRIAGKDKPTMEEALKLIGAAKEVAQGSTQVLEGKFHTGNYWWAVLNPNEEKPVRVTISLKAR